MSGTLYAHVRSLRNLVDEVQQANGDPPRSDQRHASRSPSRQLFQADESISAIRQHHSLLDGTTDRASFRHAGFTQPLAHGNAFSVTSSFRRATTMTADHFTADRSSSRQLPSTASSHRGQLQTSAVPARRRALLSTVSRWSVDDPPSWHQAARSVGRSTAAPDHHRQL